MRLRRKSPPVAGWRGPVLSAMRRFGALKLGARFVYNPRLVACQSL